MDHTAREMEGQRIDLSQNPKITYAAQLSLAVSGSPGCSESPWETVDDTLTIQDGDSPCIGRECFFSQGDGLPAVSKMETVCIGRELSFSHGNDFPAVSLQRWEEKSTV